MALDEGFEGVVDRQVQQYVGVGLVTAHEYLLVVFRWAMRRLSPWSFVLGLLVVFVGMLWKYTAFKESVKTIEPGRMVAGRSRKKLEFVRFCAELSVSVPLKHAREFVCSGYDFLNQI
jgi:hypothetical protein